MQDTGWKRDGLVYFVEVQYVGFDGGIWTRKRTYDIITYWLIYWIHGPEKMRDLAFKD